MSIELWAQSHHIEDNWLTRSLSNVLLGTVSHKELDIAKKVLKEKCLIGLLEEKGESFSRFEQYFGWKDISSSVIKDGGISNDDQIKECIERLLYWGWSNKNSHPLVEEGSKAYELLLKQNELDLELYEYAKVLFMEQTSLFQNR